VGDCRPCISPQRRVSLQCEWLVFRLGFTDLLHTPERTRGGRSEPQAAILTVEAR
jgi:hypothetical protein